MTTPKGQFSPAYFEDLEAGAAEQFDEAQQKVAGERTKFFEQLALLSGGAIILSVSLLSTLFGKVVVYGSIVLIIGWFALLAALLSSLYRALQYQLYIIEASMAHYMKTLASKKIALHQRASQGAMVVAPPDEEGRPIQRSAEELKQAAAMLYRCSEQRGKNAARLFQKVQISEKIAVHSFWIGALALALFAGYNLLKVPIGKSAVESLHLSPAKQRLISPPDRSAGFERAASCLESDRLTSLCTKQNFKPGNDPFTDIGVYEVPLPSLTQVPEGYQLEPNGKDCETAFQWANYCRINPK